MSDMKEYVVTLRNRSDIDAFYDDMESVGGDLYIPNRRVDIAQLREISRNTHYYLTDEEAVQLRNDPRVLAVELLPSALGVIPVPHWTQSGNFEKSATIDTNDKNWGLYRIAAGTALSNWGTNGSFTQTTQTVNTTSSGKHVDVVIVDAHINPNHPEFAVNTNGTGGSRVNQYDWFTHSAYLGYTTTAPYTYASVSSNHGTHVAGTVAGNTQGWARSANIYNMEFDYVNAGAPAGDWTLYIFDYIRAFHLNKSINPTTGRRNPTVVNNSWGYSYNNINISSISSVTYRGVTTAVTGTDPQRKTILENNGVPVPASTYLYRTPYRYAALEADIQDAIDDGVIIVASAGNSYWNCATAASQDYNNSVTVGVSTVFHSRGSSPGADSSAICVGSVGTATQEYKSDFSNYGSRVDIWAPGSNIVSAVYDTSAAAEFGIILVNDPRDSNYRLGSISGTSMSSPQVAGLLACLAENQPRLTQSEARSYLTTYGKVGQVGSTGGAAGDYTSLGDSSNNRHLFYRLERALSGNVAINTYKTRSSTGAAYPRTRIRRFG